jgi:sugar/nucleoside kinase (ribokinase family)
MAPQDGQIVYYPGFPFNAVDTTGAGDSFAAGLIFAHVIQGQVLTEALRFADACGALSTTGFGETAGQPTLRRVLFCSSLGAALHGSRPCPVSSL